jgi:hypothetical protein
MHGMSNDGARRRGPNVNSGTYWSGQRQAAVSSAQTVLFIDHIFYCDIDYCNFFQFTAITCDQPFLLNGKTTNSSLMFGATIKYMCEEGYILEGLENSTCVANATGNLKGKWSNPIPICTGKD